MKTPTKPTAPRMPRARVMYQDRPTPTNNGLTFHARHKRIDRDDTVGAFIPTATAQQARKIAAFFNLTEEERVEIATKACYRDVFGESWEYRSHQQEKTATSVARAVLAAITGGRT